MENNKQYLSSGEYSKALISKIQDQIICKVKFSSFSAYENVCFLPNNFDELVKIFSKAFYPNDFIIIYMNSNYNQVIVHSDSTYNEILSDIYNDDKETREVKFQIILYNVNNDIEFNISKERISSNIKTIFETEKAAFIETAKELISFEFSNQAIPSIYRSIEEIRSAAKNRKIENSCFDKKTNNRQKQQFDFSASFSLSCKNFENLFIEDFDENYLGDCRKTIYSMGNDSEKSLFDLSSKKDKSKPNKNSSINPNKIFGKSSKRYRNESPQELAEISDKNVNNNRRDAKNRSGNSSSNGKNPFSKNIVSCC